MLSYPFSLPNPRPPLFPWFSLLIGRLFGPFFGDAWKAVMVTFLLSTGLFGALTIFPTYALGKEAFGKRAGLVAALLLAVSVGHLQRSASTDADHDAFTLFFVVSTFYCFLRALKTMNRKRWVEGWFHRAAITSGLRTFFRENRASVLYALLAGLCVTVIALAWQGWAYVSVILIVWFAVELFLARFRNDDTMGTWILFTLALATPLALAFQWYLVRGQIRVWFDVPAYLFFAAFVLGLAFTVTRDYPWTLVIPSTLIAGAVGLGIGVLVNPTLANAFFTGAGYFVQTKVVTTIAEDQSPAAGSWRNAVRKSLKPRHVLVVLGIVFLVVLPNVWWAVDASIPFELKTQYDQQVANLLPSFLRAPGYSPSSGAPFYFGAFGYSIPKPTDYYPAAWEWFATQDSNTPPELRPAYLSWWDYGFEAVDRGAHPTVADNFQDGVAIAGQFITAQNETAGIAILTIRLLEGDFVTHQHDFRPAVKAVLLDAGLPVETIRSVFARPQDYISVVLADPVTFGLWAPDLQYLNAQYIFLTSLFTRRMSEDRVVSLYHDVRAATGWDIGYFAVDARLFPISGSNTGIFYAPAKLSDHRVINLPDGRVLPFEFFQILATTNRGSNIPIQFVAPGDQIQSQTIQYQAAVYNSMFYRAYIGHSPKDLNSTDTGVPGFSQALQANPPVPAWNLTHRRGRGRAPD